MLKQLLIGLSILATAFTTAQNNLVVFTLESKPFYVVLNGIRQNYTPETNVKIENLPGDFYRLKVIFEDRKFKDVEKSVSFLEKNQEISMELRLKKGKFKMRYAGAININANNSAQTNSTNQSGNENNTSIGNNNETSQNQTESSSHWVVPFHESEWSEEEQQSFEINVNISTPNIESGQSSSTTISTTTSSSTTTVSGSTSGSTSINNDDSGEANEREIYYSFMTNGTMCNASNVNDKTYLDFKYDIENANMFKRQEKVLKYFKEHCMTSSQVAGIINIDYPTVDAKTIAKEGYRNTYDTENYYVVLEALNSKSDRQDVIKFLGLESSNTPYSYSSNTNIENSSSTSSSQSQSQTSVNYSLIPSYSGYINCNKGTILKDINKLINAVNEESFGDDKLKVIQQATKHSCLKVSDLEKLLEVFNHSSEKMELLKWAWDYTYDIDNFYKLSSSLTYSGDKEELDKFIDEQSTSHFQYVYSTDFSDGTLIDVDDLEERMEDEPFADNKLKLAKQALVSRYISVEQIKQLAPQFSHESDLLKFIEMAYPRTTDQENFYKLNEVLTFSSSKDRLNEIIGE